MNAIIGIDLGTTTSAVAVAAGGVVTVIGDEPVSPSVVTYAGGELVVGRRAVELGRQHPASSFRAIKRLLGRKVDSPGVLRAARTAAFAIVAAPNRDAWVRVGGRPTPPQQIAAELLADLRRRAEDHAGQPITRAVVAVPAYFDDAQRQAVRDAGLLAGLEIVRLINEPTAAALAYGVTGEPTTVAVVDLGGGTFDVSILRVTGGVYQVLASGGDSRLGGDDWDLRIVEVLIDEIFEARGVDPTGSPAAMASLREAAEAAKIALSSADETSIEIEVDVDGPLAIRRQLSREELETLTADLGDQLAAPIRQALLDARLDRHDIDRVLAVGGMSRSPMIRERIAELLGEPITGGPLSIDPATAVAAGAAICAAVLAGDDAGATLLDVTSQSIGLRIGDHRYPGVIARGDELPAIARVTHPRPESPLVVEVFRGEARTLESNARVGTVELDVAGRLGEVDEVEIEIAADVDSMVRVSLCDRDGQVIRASTGKLQARAGLSEHQLERFVRSDLPSAVARREGGDQ